MKFITRSLLILVFLTTADGRTHRAFSRWVQLALAAACIAAALLAMRG